MSEVVNNQIPSHLPLDKLPQCWNDESRLNVLYAPFRDRNVNPKDWESKLDFWRQSICTYCTHNKAYTFNLPCLQKAFMHRGRTPMCLQMVMQEMVRGKELVPVGEFLKKQSSTWGHWATDVLLKKPLLWSFNKVKQSVFGDIDFGDDVFVHVQSLKLDGNELLVAVPSDQRNKVLEIKELMALVKSQDKESVRLLLHYLECSGEASVREISNDNVKREPFTLVKIANVKKFGGIVDNDVDVYMLTETEKILISTVEKLENDISALVKDAKEYLVKGHKQMAKNCLRKKRDAEKRLEGRSNALYNVQTLLSRVEDTTHDVHILDTYKYALDSLRSNFTEDKLSEDSVTNTMIEIGEVLDIHNDIQSSLAQPVNDVDVDLEAELEELMKSDDDNVTPKPSNTSPKPDDKISDVEKLSDELKELELPDVPQNDLSTASQTAL